MRCYFFAAIVLLITGNVYATPTVSSVSGEATHGETITISGSTFGTKPTHAPSKWDDFNSGTNGQLLSTDTRYSVSTTTSNDVLKAQYSTDKIRHAGAQSAEFYMNRVGAYDNLVTLNYTASTKWTYVDTWVWYELPEPNVGDTQIKLMKVQGGSGANSVYPIVNLFTWRYANGTRNLYSTVYNAAGTQLAEIYASDALVLNNGAWNHIQMAVRSNDIGSANGEVHWWVNGQSVINGTGYTFRASAGDADFNYAWFGWYIGNAVSGETTLYYSDYYLDSTLSRVEICDSATYADRTHCEIQIPSVWSDTSITATVNKGSFADGATAYLYVVDSTGAVSTEQRPVTFNGSNVRTPAGSGSSGNAGNLTAMGVAPNGNYSHVNIIMH